LVVIIVLREVQGVRIVLLNEVVILLMVRAKNIDFTNMPIIIINNPT